MCVGGGVGGGVLLTRQLLQPQNESQHSMIMQICLFLFVLILYVPVVILGRVFLG